MSRYKQTVAYFAHPITTYGSKAEEEILRRSSVLFKEVINPNTEEHRQNYDKQGMSYFMQKVVPKTKAIVFLAMPNGTIGAGVAKELQYYMKHDYDIIEAVPVYGGKYGYTFRYDTDNDSLRKRFLGVNETRKYIKNIMKNKRNFGR